MGEYTGAELLGFVWHESDVLFADMQENRLQEIGLATKRIGLLRKKDVVYAFAATCPHAGVPLCEGWLDGMGRIVCPLHKYRFDPANGRNTSGEGYKLLTYPVEVRDGIVFVAIRTGSF